MTMEGGENVDGRGAGMTMEGGENVDGMGGGNVDGRGRETPWHCQAT